MPTAPAIVQPVSALSSVSAQTFSGLRAQLVLHCCKWDPQVEDQPTLSPFPLAIDPGTWAELAGAAEKLSAEMLAAEVALLDRAESLYELGMDRAICRLLRGQSIDRTAPRVMRFDFHPTRAGWRISEVNSDVPGGFAESSAFAQLMAEHYPDFAVTGNPARAWCESLERTARIAAGRGNPLIALLSAPGFMEDHQVVAYLAQLLRQRSIDAIPASPDLLRWEEGRAMIGEQPVHLIVRFYQTEWLPRLPRSANWRAYIRSSTRTTICNPGAAIISESKRFPLACRRLGIPMPTWQKLLPETLDPRQIRWQGSADWVLKPAFCNTGDSVFTGDFTRISPLQGSRDRRANNREASYLTRQIALFPRRWIAQRFFEVEPTPSPIGEIFPCLGVFVVDGRAAGIYGRYTTHNLIDFRAVDAAVLRRRSCSQ